MFDQTEYENHSYTNIYNIIGFVVKEISHLFVPLRQKNNMTISFNKNKVLIKEGVNIKDDIIFHYISEKDQLL